MQKNIIEERIPTTMNMKQTFLYRALQREKGVRRQLFLTELLRALAILGACGTASLATSQVFLEKGSLSTTAPVLLVLFLMLGSLHLLGLRQAHLLQTLSDGVRASVRQKLHLHLLSRQGQTDRTLTRRLLPLALESTDALDAWFTKVLPVVLGIAVAMPCLLVAALFIDPMTGLLMLVTVPIAPFLLYLIGRVTREASEEQWREMNRFSAGLAEILRALPTLKLFSREQAERERVRGLSRDFARAALRVLQLSFVSAFALELITTLSIAIIAVSIGLRLLYGQLTFTAAFFVLLLTPEFYQPLRLSGTAFHSGMTAFTAESALSEVASNASIPRGVPGAPPFPRYLCAPHCAGSLLPLSGQPAATARLRIVRRRKRQPDGDLGAERLRQDDAHAPARRAADAREWDHPSLRNRALQLCAAGAASLQCDALGEHHAVPLGFPRGRCAGGT